ncbi:peptide chain release factor family protein [Desulfospira joergensenii]|uniref:peptide chain release factor family protein n=1 Tax=Desulfospira joergensenii TaxID=53329 RepID=UPI0003B72E6E|nr:peptide chain release factor-like protein [Desulfospira joergensenii]
MGPDKKKLDALEKRMADLGIQRQDLEEKFIRSSGRGGQKVNKSSSAVFVRHIPTGIFVKYGKHRSQHLNRFMALRSLVDRLEEKSTGKMSRETREIEKLRKQKLRRKRKSRKKAGISDQMPPKDE